MSRPPSEFILARLRKLVEEEDMDFVILSERLGESTAKLKRWCKQYGIKKVPHAGLGTCPTKKFEDVQKVA